MTAPKDGYKLFAGGLPKDCSHDELSTVFAKYGEVTHIHVMNPHPRSGLRSAFVFYANKESGDDAVKVLDEQYKFRADARRPIVVRWSKDSGFESAETPIMVAQSSVPRPSCSHRLQKRLTPAYHDASHQKEPSKPEVTELLRQLMHVQQESLTRLLKWSESKHAHHSHGIAVDAVALCGYVEELKRIVSESRSIISALDESFSKLNIPGSSEPAHGCGYPPTHYPPPPSVPELRFPLPPPPPTAPGYLPPGYSVCAQQYPASSSFPHPPNHPPPDHSQRHWQEAGGDYDWDVDARLRAEKRKRTEWKERDEAYESERQPTYKSQASEAEIKVFLGNLPEDVLSADEERMRAALMDAWKMSNERDTGKQKLRMSFAFMCSNEAVRKARAKLLPPGIPIERWMEARIPEIFVVTESRNGHVIVTLKELQEDRDLRMQEQKEAKEIERTEFLENLPEDDLSEEEHDLREALLKAWEICIKKYGTGKVRLSHICWGEDVIKAKSALLPAAVSVRHWIEARIGEEVTLSKDDEGQLLATFARESCE